MNRHLRALGALGTAALLALAGCQKTPQVSPGTRHVVQTLRTAVAAKNSQWLDENEKQIAAQHAAGTLGDEEFQVLQGIVEQARGGDWKGAQAAVTRLSQAQRPTSDEVERVKARQVEH